MVKRAIAAVIALVLSIVLVFGTAVRADATRGCVLDILGIKVCGTLLTPLPTVRVTLPPVRVTTTVNVPGPTRTITLPAAPGATKTVLVMVPGQSVTKTAQPQVGPTVGPGTKTISVSPSGQTPHTHGTIGPSKQHEPFFTFGSPKGATRTVGVGLLSLLALVAIILAGMAYAFRVGQRTALDKDTNFMREVLESTVRRGKHS